MKNLFLSLIVFSILFVIGCQENTITDPLSTESPGIQSVANGTVVKNITKDVPTIIRFENELPSPHPSNTLNECFRVAGTVQVVHKVYRIDPAAINIQYRVTANLSMNAEMSCAKGLERNCWLIRGETDDTFYLSAEGEKAIITKYYKVKGRSDRMQLACKYGVSLDGISLIDMKLTLPSARSTKTNSNL